MRNATQDRFHLSSADIGIETIRRSFAVKPCRWPPQPDTNLAGIAKAGFRFLDNSQQAAKLIGLIGGQRTQATAMSQRLPQKRQPIEFG